ncbi:jmjC domain-containing protein 4, partial [Asbolus verrucosus]
MKRALASCKPTKMWIDGKCFEIRRFQKKNKKVATESTKTDSCEKYQINTNAEVSAVFITPTFFSILSFRPYYTKLSNFPHLDLKLLEDSTNTNISIPVSGNLVITGESEEKISEARDEIHSIIGEIRDQYMAMQFVSIPTLSDEIIENFAKFKKDILNGDKIEGMEESIFQSPQKLHLTIVVFALLDDHEKSEATKALQDYKNTILDPLIKKTGPLKIKIFGIDCMSENLKKVDVLYAKASIVDENEESNLQKIVNGLSDHFYERGLVRKYQDNVKLHMTLINTKYRKNMNSPKKKRVPVINTELSYNDFFKNYLQCNIPCIIKNVTLNWEAHSKWLTDKNKPNLNYLRNKYGTCDVTVYDCNERYFNSQQTEICKLETYLDTIWGVDSPKLKYLKDWHLKNTYKEDNFYQVPIYFASDWLNEFLVENSEDDYREENVLRDALNNLPYDITQTYCDKKHFEVIQNPGEAIFVPSGWYHQVWNLEDTISINHNWVNGCNIDKMWDAIKNNLNHVKKEIEDCKDMEAFLSHCQVMLNASFGMDFLKFYDFLEFIALKRLSLLQKRSDGMLFHGHTLGANHALFDLQAVKSVLEKFHQHCDIPE